MAPQLTDDSPCREEREGGGSDADEPHAPAGFPAAPGLLILNSEDSEGDEEEGEQDGYVLLSQNETDSEAQDDQPHQHHLSATHHVTMEQEFLPWPENDGVDTFESAGEISQSGATTTSESTTPELRMDDEHIEKIKSAMSGFTLPSTAFPSWTKVVPEDQWKEHLLGLVGNQRPHLGRTGPVIATSAATLNSDS